MVFKITESMHGVAVPPTLYGQYNVVVYLCRNKQRPNSPRGVFFEYSSCECDFACQWYFLQEGTVYMM